MFEKCKALNVSATGTLLLRFEEIKEETTYVFESKVLRLNLDVTRTKKLKSKPLQWNTSFHEGLINSHARVIV